MRNKIWPKQQPKRSQIAKIFLWRVHSASVFHKVAKCSTYDAIFVFLYFKFLERDGNRGLGLLPLYSLDWIGLDINDHMPVKEFRKSVNI